jgi:hypothetical protein
MRQASTRASYVAVAANDHDRDYDRGYDHDEVHEGAVEGQRGALRASFVRVRTVVGAGLTCR